MAMAMAMAIKRNCRRGMWWAVAVLGVVVWGVGTGDRVRADSTIQNLAKAEVAVDSHTLASGATLTIAMGSDDSGSNIDLAYTKNITGVAIKNHKEYFVVENQAGTKATLAGLSVVALDLIEAKIVEASF